MWVPFVSFLVFHWTSYSHPQALHAGCHTQKTDPKETLNTTGQQCIPWTDKNSTPEKFNGDLFQPHGGKGVCQKIFKNFDNNPKSGLSATEKSSFKEQCHSQSCRREECNSTHTVNRHPGKFNATKRKRNCQNCLLKASQAKANGDAVAVKKNSDSSLENAERLFKDSTENLTDSWCSEEDKRFPRDLCYVRNCDKPLESTILTSGFLRGTFIFIQPSWRKNGLHFWLKAWNPDIYEGLVVSFSSRFYLQEYILLIGIEEGEKVKLYFQNDKRVSLLVQKTLPHLIPVGKWKGFWLRTGHGKIELGYDGVSYSFFEWTACGDDVAFEPIFLNFGTIKNHIMSVNFRNNECLTIQASTKRGYKIFPINLWRDEIVTSSLRVSLRGLGSAFINLMWVEGFQKYFGIQISSSETNIVLVQYVENIPTALAVFYTSSTITETKWSEYVIGFTEDSLSLSKDGTHVFEWKSPFPLVFDWFTVTAEEGSIVWTANCPAPDIDGGPRDGSWGKWGPWSCSVTCGKGHGRIERTCNDPAPNIFGHECKGKPVYEGPCNDFPCGKISPDTYNSIRSYLSSQHKSLQVDVSEKVVLACNPQALSLISLEVSEMNITWTHNGFPYSRTKFHMDENYSLVIHRAQEKHNGIYLCVAYQDPEAVPSKIVLEVISLVVIKPKPKKVREGKSVTLKCNGLALSYVYADLSQRWELNGTVWKDYGLGTLETYTMDKLQNISEYHSGIWTCVIIQEDFKFKWTTNWIYLKVKSAPSLWSHLLENVATAPNFKNLLNESNALLMCLAVFVTLTCFLILIICLCISCLQRIFFGKTKK